MGEVRMTKAVKNDINTFTQGLVLSQLQEDGIFEDTVCSEKELINITAKRTAEVMNKFYQDFLLKQGNVFNPETLAIVRQEVSEIRAW